VALSCGGLVWEQRRGGEVVSVWTISAGDPPEGPLSLFAESLHERWQTGRGTVAQRRREDQASCATLMARPGYFPIPDCIYRRSEVDGAALYASEGAIMGPVHPLEAPLVEQLSRELERRLPKEAEIVAPMALGGHVDHRLVRQAAQELVRPLWYYADVPYALSRAEELKKLDESGWKATTYPVSEAGLAAWQAAVAAHASQISTFWPDLESMRAAIRSYCEKSGGVRLWQAP
jgi:LmbE family N-acetylglucosaminyl deacetylase